MAHQRAMDGGGGMDNGGVHYAMFCRLNNEVRDIGQGLGHAFAQINNLGAHDSPLQHVQINALCRRMESLETDAKEKGKVPLP